MGETARAKLKVFVTDTGMDSAAAFLCSPGESILNMRSKLAEKYNISFDEITLTHNDRILLDKCLLSEIAEIGSILDLTADRKISIDFSIYKSPTVVREKYYSVFPSVLPKDLDEPIRELFKIKRKRKFRLRTAAGPLDDKRSLRDNGICDTPHIMVDLAYDVNLTDSWSGDTQSLALFASAMVNEMGNVNVEGERIFYKNTAINAFGDVADALTAVEGDVSETITLQSSYQRRIFALSENATSEHLVWPHEPLGRLKSGCQLSVPFVCESRKASARNTFFDLQVCDHAVVDIEPLEIVLTSTASLKTFKVSLSRTACVRDLMVEAATIYHLPLDQIRLKCHGRYIEDMTGAVLGQAGVRHEDQVHVIPAITKMKVHVDGNIWKHSFAKKSVGFSDIVFVLCDDKNLDVIDTTMESFHCMGCGRKLTLEEEAFQQVPAPCCRVQSLELRLVRTRDIGIQGRTFSGEKQADLSPIDSSNAIRLRLRQFNMRDVIYVGSNEDTLENIVTFLRRQNRLMGIRTIHADERELTFPPNWRKIKLRDCNLENDQLLTIEFITYNHFRIEILSPTSQWPTCHHIWLHGREKSLEGIRWHLKARLSFKIDQSTMIFQLGTFYRDKRGQMSRSILSYNQTTNQGEFLDEDSGTTVSYANSSHEFREMLFLGFGFRAAPTHPPILTFFMESKLFRLGDISEHDSWMEMQTTDIRNGKFVMMLEGVLYDGEMFIQCTDNTFFDVVSGEGYPDEETLRGRYGMVSDTNFQSFRSFCRIFLFLKAEDKVPLFPVPAEKYIGFYLRRDVDISLEYGILKSSDIPTNCELTWMRTIHVSSFQKKLTKWMKAQD